MKFSEMPYKRVEIEEVEGFSVFDEIENMTKDTYMVVEMSALQLEFVTHNRRRFCA